MINNQPLLTVIITSYNHANYIKQTIASFLGQTFTNFELLIIDDKSDDNSVEIIKSFNDSRIKLIALNTNGGICRASNIGIENAQGKYIKFFASDDIALPTLLEKQVNFLEQNPAYDAVFCGIEVIDENGISLPKKTKKFEKFFTNINRSQEEWLHHFFFKGNCLATPTVVVKKELVQKINGLDERLSQAHDFNMWVKFCIYGSNIYVLNEKLVQYRRLVNNKNMSSNTANVRARLVFDNEKILQNFLAIENISILVKIFPNLKELESKIIKDLIPFFVAQEALKVNSCHHKQFALSTLYNLLSNHKIQTILETQFDFKTNKDFYNIVSNNPLGVMLETIQRKQLYRRFLRSIGDIIFSKRAS